jgi:hypothetical protein
MLRAIRPKLTFANVMVVILTFAVLGGSAYAATSLPKNSVGAKQLKNGAVTQSKIAKAAQKALRGATGPQGPRGPEGPAGSQGPEGPRGDGIAPGATLPTGTTLRGVAVAAIGTPTPGSNSASAGISFGGYQLPARPAANVVAPGGPPSAQCPGTSAAPEAAPGNLCVYLTSTVPSGAGQVIVFDPSRTEASGINYDVAAKTTSVSGAGRVATFGFRLTYSQNTANAPQLAGSWAVTG